MAQDKNISALLDEIPPERLSRETKKLLIKLRQSLDEVGRIDEDTGEFYVEEKSLRKMLKEHTPPGFEDRCIAFLKSAPDSHLLVADSTKRKPGKAVDWQTLVRRTVLGRMPQQEESFESLGLTIKSTNQELKQALQQRMPDLSEKLFEPNLAVRMQEAVDTMGGVGVSASGLGADAYWQRFKNCMTNAVGIFVTVVVLAVIVGLAIDFLALPIVLGGLSELFVAYWVIAIVACFIDAID